MSDVYTVEQVIPGEPFGEPGDKMVPYELILQGFDQPAFRYLPENAAHNKRPKVGDTGTLDFSKKKPKFVPSGRSSGSQNGAGGGDDYARRPEHPRNEARMIRNGALSSAPALYEQMRTEGVLDKAPDKASYLNTIAGIVEWVENGIRQSMDDAESAPPF